MKNNLYKCEISLRVQGTATFSIVGTQLTVIAHTPEEACDKLKKTLDVSIVSVTPKLIKSDFC